MHFIIKCSIALAKAAMPPQIGTLLGDEEKLADSLDYLHIQTVKTQQPARLKLAEAKAALALD